MASSRVCAIVLCGLAASAAGSASGVSARQARVASERAAGPAVDFVAVDADGNPVAGLQPSEVEVRLNGRVRTIRSVRRVSAAAAPMAARTPLAVPAPYGTNDGVAVGRSVVLIVDEESFIGGREQPLRNAVEGLLAELTPADRTMLMALPYGGVKAAFTSDVARIRLAMAGLSGQGSRDETGSDMACRTRTFLESLDGFLQTQAGRWTPLTVVLFTAGLSAPRRDAPMALAPGKCEILVNHYQRITVTAGAARANFYVIEPADMATRSGAAPSDGFAGARAPSGGWREGIAGTGYLGSDNPLEGIENLAGATGAPRLPLDATGTGSLRRVAREASAYYVAEIEPERGEVYGRSRPVAVRVLRPGVTVRARPEITFVEDGRRGGATRLTVQDLLVSGEAFTELPLRAAGFTVREKADRLRVGVVVEPVDPAASLTSVGAMLVEKDGRIVARWSASDATERPLLGAMAASPGTYRLRVAAIDAAGRAGVAEDLVDARLVAVGPLTLGSLILGASRADTMTPQLEFGAEPSAIASFDIYGGVAGMRLAATLEVARTVDGPAIVALPLALTRADEGRVLATVAVPIGAMQPGDYVVRGIIQLEDGTEGRVMRTLRKVGPDSGSAVPPPPTLRGRVTPGTPR